MILGVDMTKDILDQIYRDIINIQIEQGIRTVDDLPFIAREYPFVLCNAMT